MSNPVPARIVIVEDVILATILEPHLTSVKADPGRMEQVIMNLAVKARDPMPQGGRLTIETANVTLDSDYTETHTPMIPGTYVMLAISDNGQGMDAETLLCILEPFFTKKDVGQGTGLGLSTVYGIVKQSGGYTWVYSELGQDTTFKMCLPVVQETPKSIAVSGQSAELCQGTATILVVKDHETVRALACHALQKWGYHVLEAAMGRMPCRLVKDMTVSSVWC